MRACNSKPGPEDMDLATRAFSFDDDDDLPARVSPCPPDFDDDEDAALRKDLWDAEDWPRGRWRRETDREEEYGCVGNHAARYPRKRVEAARWGAERLRADVARSILESPARVAPRPPRRSAPNVAPPLPRPRR